MTNSNSKKEYNPLYRPGDIVADESMAGYKTAKIIKDKGNYLYAIKDADRDYEPCVGEYYYYRDTWREDWIDVLVARKIT